MCPEGIYINCAFGNSAAYEAWVTSCWPAWRSGCIWDTWWGRTHLSLTLNVKDCSLLPQDWQPLGGRGLTDVSIVILILKTFQRFPTIYPDFSFLLPTHPSIHPSIYPSIHLSIHPSFHPSIHLNSFIASFDDSLTYPDLISYSPKHLHFNIWSFSLSNIVYLYLSSTVIIIYCLSIK